MVPRDSRALYTTEAAESYDPDTRRRYEYLDSVVHYSIDRMALRLHLISRGQRVDSSIADLRGHCPDTPLRSRKKSSLIRVFGYPESAADR
jgi:hypothetical protein